MCQYPASSEPAPALVHIKCTKKLIARTCVKPTAAASTGNLILGDWHANIIPVWGGEIIICLGDQSLLTMVLPATAAADLGVALKARVLAMLDRINVPEDFLRAAENEFSEIVIRKADSRSTLGRLNQAAGPCQDMIDLKHMNQSQRAIEDHFLQWLYGPEPYQRPADALHELILAHERRIGST